MVSMAVPAESNQVAIEFFPAPLVSPVMDVERTGRIAKLAPVARARQGR
jgi:hypothetical protein